MPNAVSTLPNVVKFNIEIHNAFSTLLGVVNYNVDVHNVVNVDLTLCDVATSYQPKNNVEMFAGDIPIVKSQAAWMHLRYISETSHAASRRHLTEG